MGCEVLDRRNKHRIALKKRLAKIQLARTDVNHYIEYTSRVPPQNPEICTKERWAVQDPIHREWQAEWSNKRRSIILGPVGTGKSSQIRGKLEHEMGLNPNVLISYISASELLPKKQIAAMQENIDRNPRVRHVFPELRKATSTGDGRESWSAKAMLIARSALGEKDPTVQVFGKFGKILGSRSDIIVLDDLINFENSLTEPSRDKIYDWLAECISRLKPGARVWAVGHIWDELDALQRFARKKNWVAGYKRYECFTVDEAKVRDNLGLAKDDEQEIKIEPYSLTEEETKQRIEDGELKSVAPNVLTESDILEKMEELGPVFTQMMLFNRLPGNITSRFAEVYFERCLQLGRGMATERNPEGFLKQWNGGDGLVYTGVDLGHRKKAGSDKTVMFTAAVLPNGLCQIIDVRSGLWKVGEILHNLKQIHTMFGALIAVENNGAQEMLLEIAEFLTCIPVRPHATTGINKNDFSHGVEAMADQLRQGKWMIPCNDWLVPGPEVGACIRACKVYDPKSHTPDHLMAWWICKEAIRMSPSAQNQEFDPIDTLTRY